MEEISRKEALKRGAAVGLGVLWATPAVQAVSMVRSAAAATSPPPDEPVYYAVKIEEDDRCEDIFDQIGRDTSNSAPTGKCLTPNKGSLGVIPGGCKRVEDVDTDDDEPWVIELADGCEIIEDACLVYTKAGTECLKDRAKRDGQTWYFANPASNGKEISHIEFVICCRPPKD